MMRDVYDWNLMQKEKERRLNPIFMNSTVELRSYQLPHSQINPSEHTRKIVKCENKNEKR